MNVLISPFFEIIFGEFIPFLVVVVVVAVKRIGKINLDIITLFMGKVNAKPNILGDKVGNFIYALFHRLNSNFSFRRLFKSNLHNAEPHKRKWVHTTVVLVVGIPT